MRWLNVDLFIFADSQDVDLDAILGELCALERRCDGDIASTPAPDTQRPGRPNSGRINTGENTTDIGKNDGGMCVCRLYSTSILFSTSLMYAVKRCFVDYCFFVFFSFRYAHG